MGTVPITAGPSVPIMTLDTPSLQAVPGKRWIAILYVTNNSGADDQSDRRLPFHQPRPEGRMIRLIVPPAGPGERLGIAVRGPRVDMFVDSAVCLPMAQLPREPARAWHFA